MDIPSTIEPIIVNNVNYNRRSPLNCPIWTWLLLVVCLTVAAICVWITEFLNYYEANLKCYKLPSCELVLAWTWTSDGQELLIIPWILVFLTYTLYYLKKRFISKAKPELKSISDDHSNVTRHPLVRFVYDIINNSHIIPVQDHDDLTNLMDELRDVTDWQKLGLQLKIRQSVLEEVEMNEVQCDIAKMKRSMLIRWLKSNPDAAWEDLLTALKCMDENRTAKIIEDKYCTTSS